LGRGSLRPKNPLNFSPVFFSLGPIAAKPIGFLAGTRVLFYNTGLESKQVNRETRLPWRLAVVSAISLLAAAGCGHRTYTTQPPAPVPQPSAPPSPIERQPVVPGEYVEEGVASWYGIPFDGHRTSNGETYDMHAFTAAHRTLPFGAVVRVTNLRNGQQTEVRINDRGPFVANRIIDLSLSAAQAIGMVGTGTAQVRLEVLSGPNPQVGFFGVQVGAFASQDNAARLRAQLATRYSSVSIAVYDSPNGIFYRVRVGRLPTEDAAHQLAGQLRSDEQLTTFIVVRLDD
jgi:rare lipoprotein A